MRRRYLPHVPRKLSAFILLLCALGGAAAGARRWWPAAASPPPTVSAAAEGNETEAVVLTLGPEGFEPAEVTVSHGRHILVVLNRTGLGEVTLRLDRVGGERLREERVGRRRRNWTQALDLTPGEYVLTEAGHPEWSCHVTVTPRQPGS